jgi:hypothetical protein
MKDFITRIFRGARHISGGEPQPLPSEPLAGQVYSFQTKPYSEFAPPDTARFAAFKVIGVADQHIAIVVLDGIWPEAPTIREVQSTSTIKEHRFAHTGRPANFGVNREWWQPEKDLQEFGFVGMAAVSSAEKSFANAIASFAIGSSFSTIHSVNYTAEGEWRWSNDREAFVEEGELDRAKNEAVRAAKEERYRSRLSKLTWDQLKSETPFSNWSPSPPFPPEEFTNAARSVIRDACSSLQELGPKPRKADVRSILKKTVQWFNDADDEAGNVIETEEREDICAVLEEMAFVARQKTLVDEIDEWRDW